ncbi:terminase [Agrobacterium tumefaciens]|uniref:terminase n=1 Tax=Agrobacterium tumefaciens TaxID=358 RepID=UPI0021CF438B|nr:terminase [Agrobacterium tumefaciens]UXS09210.1 terminase [Agrobacterium tumefaciens]UXS16569.1 terminase [Agrobacterium tumefaciens]
MGKIQLRRIAWSPQEGPQSALVDCPYREIFFGGARGGGKTDGVLGKYAIKAAIYGSAFNALFCRRELPMLDDAIDRSKEIYGKIGAGWNDQKKTWTFPGGGRLRFRPLERVQDADKYQGQNVSDACIEEAGLYPDSKPIDRLFGVLRSARGVPTQLILTGNPGGAGQHWIKQRYIDQAPQGMVPLSRLLPNGKTHRYVYIPSRVQDNKLLLENDPEYINNLYLVGSEQLVKAWLSGDWNAVEGAFFDCWNSSKHIIRPFAIPKDWTRFRSMDWGSAHPFSVGWWAIVSDDYRTENGVLPRGSIIRYREWYGCKEGEANVGLKLTAEEVGIGIATREGAEFNDAQRMIKPPTEPIAYGVLDPAVFGEDGGPSIYERLSRATEFKVVFRPADNKRVPAHGAMGGWDQMRGRMKGDGDRPGLYVFSTCKDFIRTVPLLQHDPNRAEDLDTTSEDHIADEVRYACMSRPYVVMKDTKKNDNAQRDWFEEPDDDDDSPDWKVA